MIDESLEATIRRMKQIRAYFGRDANGDPVAQEKFAARFGISDSAWSNFERTRRPGLDNALGIVRHLPMLTLDWIYRGDPRGVQLDVIRALEAAGEPPPRTKVKSGRP
jgi:hypothetical protein